MDLSVAYDIVNHIILLFKIYNGFIAYHMVQVIKSLLDSRRFYVQFDNKKVDGETNEMASSRKSFCTYII